MKFGLPGLEVFVSPRDDSGEPDSDEVVVRVRISGISEKDIELEVREDFLKVKIEKEFVGGEEDEGYSFSEWSSSSFEGKVFLPCRVVPIVTEKVYDGKVLEIRLKKSE